MPRKGSLLTKTKKELEEEERLEKERLAKELAGFRNNKHRGKFILVKKPEGKG